MDARSLSVLDDIIVSACRAVFEGVGAATLEPAETIERDTDDIGASIGFTGSTFRGALVLISSKQLIKNVLPVEGRGEESAQIADWMGELSNQTLGRIKNKLLAYGVTLEMSTPTVLFGLALSRRNTGSIVRRQFCFKSNVDTLAVSLDALTSPGFELAEQAAVGAGVAEGEIALF